MYANTYIEEGVETAQQEAVDAEALETGRALGGRRRGGGSGGGSRVVLLGVRRERPPEQPVGRVAHLSRHTRSHAERT